MIRMGLPVPSGFVLSIHAFQRFMEETGAGAEILGYLGAAGEMLEDLRQAEDTSRYIRESIEKREVPREIRHEVEASYKKLSEQHGAKEMAVAVRSSGLASYPGLFDTYLNVKGSSELIQRAKDCWAGVFSPRAIATRAREGRTAQIEPIAVGVQKMIPARAAGVLFTADPITNDPSMVVVEASWGLGESVAQAKVTPDKFVVNKEALDIKKKYIGQKACQVVAVEQGTRIEEVPREKQATPCLSDEELIELVKLAKLVELHYGGIPQDIEWAVDAGLPSPKNIFLIQARPVINPSPRTSKFDKPAGKSDAEHVAELLIEHLYR
jgi:pyruvate,water dikinase